MSGFRNRSFILLFLLGIPFLNSFPSNAQSNNPKPVRLAVAGISHDHVGWILTRKKPDITLVGIYEPNKELAELYAKKYQLDATLFYNDLNKMLDAVKPEAVVGFGPILDHLSIVETCAPRGIHIMVEKPLATTIEYAQRMAALANQYHIYLLTDFETSWYPTTAKTYQLINDSNYIGTIRKVVIHDGHEGPKEIGVSKYFFDWLTDPVKNGGGALMDFGCYGANLMTWLMHGQEPISVTAVTKHYKPDIYPKVEDDANIIVNYPSATCIIQASWNWPFGRKDMEVYGETGYLITKDNSNMRIKNKKIGDEKSLKLNSSDVEVYEDPFSYFADAIRGKIKVPQNGLYSLENNLTVVKILNAAKESAKTGKTIMLENKKAAE
jgi:predicted dehydrogenase